jgi:hypothetical protein
MTSIQDAKVRLKQAQEAVEFYQLELERTEDAVENNVYPDIETAQEAITSRMYTRASDACAGSYNLGSDQYTCPFVVEGLKYTAKVEIEYNRYDKQYYYVDGTKFSYTVFKEQA